jgi:HAMP domain-containing protein
LVDGPTFGLRTKFNLLLLPVLATGMLLFVGLDYRHEVRAVMAAHAMHVSAVGAPAASGPIDAATAPEAVARESLRLHALIALLVMSGLGGAVNMALRWLVLQPVDRIATALRQMEQGHWDVRLADGANDEVGRLARSFGDLGLSLDVRLFQAMYADRMAVLALLQKRVSRTLEPEVQRLGRVIGGLAEIDAPAAHAARHEAAAVAATLMGVVRELDAVIDAGVQQSREATARARRDGASSLPH